MTITKLPEATPSQMKQHEWWHAAQKGMSLTDFRRTSQHQYRTMKAVERSTAKMCLKVHTLTHVKEQDGYDIYHCRICKAYRLQKAAA